MIISASRRTDIPSYYSEWFMNRISEGFVCVRNPMNRRQVSRISLSPDRVDGIVFWTKNPIPMMDKLDALQNYMYYFQFTVNAYGGDVESNIPSKNDVIVPAFQALSRKISKERVIWRYDPILLTEKYTMDYHLTYFEALAKKLSGYTEKCVISFLDIYRNTQSNMKAHILKPLTDENMLFMAEKMTGIAGKYHIGIESCAEAIDLESAGVSHGACIDGALFERLLGRKLTIQKDRNQRAACGCMQSVDIGLYDTCKNGCLYCYANHSMKTAEKNIALYDANSPLLCGRLEEGDIIKDRQ